MEISRQLNMMDTVVGAEVDNALKQARCVFNVPDQEHLTRNKGRRSTVVLCIEYVQNNVYHDLTAAS
jgi:hypothetical protein